MESNKRAIKALITLVLTVLILFFLERKFLVAQIRGETLINYGKIKWLDKIVLLIDDFEGLKSDSISIQQVGFFGYGSAKISLDSSQIDNNMIASKTCLKVIWNGKDSYGGWGKGVGKNIDINTLTDYINFRIYVPTSNGKTDSIKISLEEDDNASGVLEHDKDDSWFYKLKISSADKWQFISIPLKDFVDANVGGDSVLNITRKGGLHTIIFSFEEADKYTPHHKWYFDFICITNGKIYN